MSDTAKLFAAIKPVIAKAKEWREYDERLEAALSHQTATPTSVVWISDVLGDIEKTTAEFDDAVDEIEKLSDEDEDHLNDAHTLLDNFYERYAKAVRQLGIA